jgi:hypothetical protein
MARAKDGAQLLSLRCEIGARCRVIRMDLYGASQQFHRDMPASYRNWWNWERGVEMPGTVMLRFLELTGASPVWLLRGTGPRYAADINSQSPTIRSLALRVISTARRVLAAEASRQL